VLSQRFLSRLLALGLLAVLLPDPALGQAEEHETRSRLEQLQRDIKRINREISSDSARKNTLQQQLRKAEKELGELQRDMAANKTAIKASETELGELNQQRSELEQARDAQQARIALELKTAWQLGQQGQVKVLLNQENTHTVARAMAYYRYFFQARNELVSSYRETLAQLQALEQRIATTLEQLALQQESLEQQQAGLVAAQVTREQALAQLNDSLKGKAAQLKQMEQNRKELEGLLAAIEKAVADLEVPDDYQPFKSAKGKMPWPLAGKRSNSFGRPRNEGKMRWQGVTIPAKEGSSVKAIHHGRVVYADWLRGSGLLLIIDHGDGYMSLYAHNQSLLREVGEWVTAGTPVSTVGNTGGQERSALYFEIRHQGKPTNPTRWCKG
jgi:septal ring factor EnvC (AmiA/AmiB activator)